MDWNSQLQGWNIATSWFPFSETLIKLIEKYIPVSNMRGVGVKNNPYVNRNCPQAIENGKTDENYDNYKMPRNAVTSELRKAKGFI